MNSKCAIKKVVSSNECEMSVVFYKGSSSICEITSYEQVTDKERERSEV